MMLYESVFCCIWALLLVFATCDLSQLYTNAYEAIEDAVTKIDWYLVPYDLHPTLLILTIYTQKTFEIVFFGSSACNREQFKRVSVIGTRCYSYWMRDTMKNFIYLQVVNTGYKGFMAFRKLYWALKIMRRFCLAKRYNITVYGKEPLNTMIYH